MAASAVSASAASCVGVFGALVFCALPLGYGVLECYQLHASATVEYDKKSCTVVRSQMDSWEWHDEDGERTIDPPKVLVQVSDDTREPPGEIWAFRYTEQSSSTEDVDYKPSADAWMDQFVPATQVPCWQGRDDPEVVKLEEGRAAQGWGVYVNPVLCILFGLGVGGVLAWALAQQGGTKNRDLVLEENAEEEDGREVDPVNKRTRGLQPTQEVQRPLASSRTVALPPAPIVPAATLGATPSVRYTQVIRGAPSARLTPAAPATPPVLKPATSATPPGLTPATSVTSVTSPLLSQIRPAPVTLADGAEVQVPSAVEAYWPDFDQWLPATLTAVNPDGWKTVVWNEDGSSSEVPPDYVRKPRRQTV